MTSPVPRETLSPILKQALRWDPLPGPSEVLAHNVFTVKECHVLVDAVLQDEHPEFHVHEQTVRQLLKDWAEAGNFGVYARESELHEHPTATGIGNRVVLYSLTNPVPAWDPEFSQRLRELMPMPRVLGRLRRQRTLAKSEADETISRLVKEPGADEPNARAELICTLVRELVTDMASVDTLQARDDEIRELRADLAHARAQAKSAERALRKIRAALGDVD